MRVLPGLLTFAPLALASLLFLRMAALQVPGDWPLALFAPRAEIGQLVLHLAVFPRFVAALLAGAALGLAGAILQRVFANPLAEPGTIGVLAGAQTALTALLIWAPGWAMAARLPVAMSGGVLAFLLVLVLALRQGVSALSLILSGLVVTLLLGGLNAMLALFHHDVLQSLFLWQAGSLAQDGWHGIAVLACALAGGLVLAAVTERPLRLIEAGDDTARSLGASPQYWRAGLAALAILLASASAATVGAVGFIGLLTPALLRQAGEARPPAWRVAVTGGGLLALADQLTQLLPAGLGLQTGTVIALTGSLLLLWMLNSLRGSPEEVSTDTIGPAMHRLPAWLPVIILPALSLIALSVGRTPDGWQVSLIPMLEWRLPRVIAAIAAGASFGLAGAVMQRLMGNRMAGPELLGISGAASLGLVAAVLLWGADGRAGLYLGTGTGALSGLALITLIAARRRFSARDMLLSGLAVSMLLSAFLAALLSSGHPRAGQLLSWLSGSTYRVDIADAGIALMAVLALLPAALAVRRWLDLLPLGAETARALGVPLRPARTALVLIAALATTTGTLLIGPLGFVGLLAPNLARSLAPHRAANQIPVAMICGASLMLLADWLGRIVIFPWQIPAGLMGLALGGAVLMMLLWRRPG